MNILHQRQSLKERLRNKERLFAGWVSYAHPSIAETFAQMDLDFLAIDMEHATINLEQAQRIIACCQAHDVPCLPRPVSHSNDWTKPLLDSGADGLIYPMVSHPKAVDDLVAITKFPPIGQRSYGVNRAQGYGFSFDSYVKTWNDSSVLIPQIESVSGVQHIDGILDCEHVDGVMVGPYDLSGSLGYPGQIEHPTVIEATDRVIAACNRMGKSCGTQVAEVHLSSLNALFDRGYNFVILSSDLFVLTQWAQNMNQLINTLQD